MSVEWKVRQLMDLTYPISASEMLKIKVQSLQNGVHRGKKPETEVKSKTG